MPLCKSIVATNGLGGMSFTASPEACAGDKYSLNSSQVDCLTLACYTLSYGVIEVTFECRHAKYRVYCARYSLIN